MSGAAWATASTGTMRAADERQEEAEAGRARLHEEHRKFDIIMLLQKEKGRTRFGSVEIFS